LIPGWIDYIITNTLCNISTDHNPELSDHIIFKVSLIPLKAKKKGRLQVDRQTLFQEMMRFRNLKIGDMTRYIKNNLHNYLRYSISKEKSWNAEELVIPQDLKESVKQWIEDFKAMFIGVVEDRFSENQGFAFAMMRSITKYDQFQKRDGSIISCLKLPCDTVTADSESVCKNIN